MNLISLFIPLLALGIHPDPCLYRQAFERVQPFHVHWIWQTEDDSGITPFPECIPDNYRFKWRRVIER